MKDNTWIVGANPNSGARKKLDYYPTPPEATEALILFLKDAGFLTDCKIWECACGDGSMSAVLEKNGYEVISTDIYSDCYGTGNINFLTTLNIPKCDWIITNPPFNVSEQFIMRSIEIGVPFALLLKSQYWHSKKRYDLFNVRKPAYVLPLTWRPDFTGEGSSLLDMAWTVWLKDDAKTMYVPLEKPDECSVSVGLKERPQEEQMNIFDFLERK